jgi:predicted amidohydrolase
MADHERLSGGEGVAMKYDLLLSGGEVLDPAAGSHGLMDIGIAGGKIVAVAPSLPASEARHTIGAKAGVMAPGLVDIHAHISVNAHDMAGDTHRFCTVTAKRRLIAQMTIKDGRVWYERPAE